MFRKLIQTNDDTAGLIARLMLGAVILPHGLQKLLGLFGGPGFSRTLDHFAGQGQPRVVALLIILGESFGALGLIAGCLSRFAAFGISVIMLGAIYLQHLQNGFFMNWYGAQQGEGYEYHLLALGLGLVVIFSGSGRWSIDRLLTERIFNK